MRSVQLAWFLSDFERKGKAAPVFTMRQEARGDYYGGESVGPPAAPMSLSITATKYFCFSQMPKAPVTRIHQMLRDEGRIECASQAFIFSNILPLPSRHAPGEGQRRPGQHRQPKGAAEGCRRISGIRRFLAV
jgi:hypothetical protein